MTKCPVTYSGQHSIEWVAVPAHYFNGELMAPAHNRGVCHFCGETFTSLTVSPGSDRFDLSGLTDTNHN